MESHIPSFILRKEGGRKKKGRSQVEFLSYFVFLVTHALFLVFAACEDYKEANGNVNKRERENIKRGR